MPVHLKSFRLKEREREHRSPPVRSSRVRREREKRWRKRDKEEDEDLSEEDKAREGRRRDKGRRDRSPPLSGPTSSFSRLPGGKGSMYIAGIVCLLLFVVVAEAAIFLAFIDAGGLQEGGSHPFREKIVSLAEKVRGVVSRKKKAETLGDRADSVEAPTVSVISDLIPEKTEEAKQDEVDTPSTSKNIHEVEPNPEPPLHRVKEDATKPAVAAPVEEAVANLRYLSAASSWELPVTCDLSELKKGLSGNQEDPLSYEPPLFPPPREIWWRAEEGRGSEGCSVVSPVVKVSCPSGCSSRMISRMSTLFTKCILKPSGKDPKACLQIQEIRLLPGSVSRSAFPTLETDYSYQVDCISGRCAVVGGSEWGALYGGEALWQLLREGQIPWTHLHLKDSPSLPWRGVMMDMGRRFVPMPLLLRILEGMVQARLNVLHLHINDFCRFSIGIEGNPLWDRALSSADGHQEGGEGQLTREEVKDLVGLAREMGIRVVPEIDIPGHAQVIFKT